MLQTRMMALIIGFFLDLIIGDPLFLWHPVISIGKLLMFFVKKMEQLFGVDLNSQEKRNVKKERIAGFLLVILVLSSTAFVIAVFLHIASRISPYLRLILESIICYQVLATKSLKKESMKVYQKLIQRDLSGARRFVSYIVGRDTDALSYEGVTKAAVETIAENTSDGVIAPLFYFVLFGPVGGMVYKAVNTMDSMIGYKNDRYLDMGYAAAKLDDIVNFVPARVAALLMIVASALLRYDTKGAISIFLRDRYRHASPNSAQTEAVCAGALSIELAGDATYFGILHHKMTIGDAKRAIEAADIKRANRLLYVTAFLAFFLSLGILYGISLAG